ncbi:hypothetical protein KJ975_08480 [Myxococcota bacterium]|nr:hypothetical protein [Myxococcota bacterium]
MDESSCPLRGVGRRDLQVMRPASSACGPRWRRLLVVALGLVALGGVACSREGQPASQHRLEHDAAFPRSGASATAGDPNRCGASGETCTAGPRALPVCVDGRCSQACRVGYADCDGDPATSCETEVLIDPCHCKNCGRTCPPGEFCVAGLCQGRQDPLVRTGPPAPANCNAR